MIPQFYFFLLGSCWFSLDLVHGFATGSHSLATQRLRQTTSTESVSANLSRSSRRSVSMANYAFESVARAESSLLEELRRREVLESPKKDDNRKSEFEPNLGKVIDTLRTDYPMLLDAPLDYSIYTDDIVLKDPSGVVFRGLNTYKRLFATLRFFRNTLIDNVDTRFRVVYDWTNKRVRVNWHMTVTFKARMNHPAFVDCISVYQINDEGFIKAHNLETIMINGEGSAFDFNQMMGVWSRSKELALASATRNHAVSNFNDMLEKSILKFKLGNSWFSWPNVELPSGCDNSWDCDSPMQCCDFVLFKVCCNEGMGNPVSEPRLVPIPIPVEDFPGYPPRYPDYY